MPRKSTITGRQRKRRSREGEEKKSDREGIYRESGLQKVGKAEKRDSNQRETENPLKRTSAHIARRGATGPKSTLTNRSLGWEIPGLGKIAPKYQRC